MSTDQPPPGQPPDDDPFAKKPPPPPPGGGTGGPGGEGGHGPASPGEPGGPGPGGGPYGGSPYGGGPYGAPPPPYSGGAADPLAGMPPLAPPAKRIAARVIDALIVGIPLGLIGWGIGMFDRYDGDDWDEVSTQVSSGKGLVWQLVTLVVYIGYDTYLTAKNGQTVGKRLMNLRVAMLNSGMIPETNASLLRAIVLWVPALICCFCLWWLINGIMILVDKPYKQGLHDKAARTVVVSTA